MAALRLIVSGSFVLASVGCTAFEPSPTPHPALLALTNRPGPILLAGEVELVDPRHLQGSPIGEVEAVQRATARMDPATAGGPVVVWGAQVALRGGSRLGWIVLRADPRDPELTGRVFPLEVAVIDAMTGEDLLLRLGRPVPVVPRLVAPFPTEVAEPS